MSNMAGQLNPGVSLAVLVCSGLAHVSTIPVPSFEPVESYSEEWYSLFRIGVSFIFTPVLGKTGMSLEHNHGITGQ